MATTEPKKIRWWQSIRGRLALGSILVTLLAVCSLMLTAIIAIVYYYESDMRQRMSELASSGAQQMSVEYSVLMSTNQAGTPPNSNQALYKAASVMHKSMDEQYLMAVFNQSNNRPIYPRPGTTSSSNAPESTRVTLFLRQLGFDQQAGDVQKIHQAILNAHKGIATSDEFSRSWLPQPFVARPIFDNGDSGKVIGVLFITPVAAIEKTVPLFIAQVGSIVLLASLIVIIIAAGAATLFSRTITLPLAKLATATRKMGQGDYATRVQSDAPGELGELATTFNEMAAQLSKDVEELRKQELWRRELIMSITHDLATPLTAIAGLGEALADGVNQSREDYEATGHIIMRETLRLRRLVRDLHMMAKVEAGALHPQRQHVRLAALVDETLAVLVPEFERMHVEPQNAISYQLPPVQADPDMLSRVFANLCDNAIHHTPAGGQMTIEAVIAPSSHEPAAQPNNNALVRQPAGQEIRIMVTDTGEGIPPEALSQVFERFYRADSARRSTTGGSGLGLAIVRAIVEAHGGRVWAENVPQGGARIVFTLPLQPGGQTSFSEATTLPLLKVRTTAS